MSMNMPPTPGCRAEAWPACGFRTRLGYQPVNKYLPPRSRRDGCSSKTAAATEEKVAFPSASPLLRWMDRILSR